MKRKSILALLLAALLLSGCGGTSTTETTSESTETMETTPAETEPTLESVTASYNDRDYGGHTFRVADRNYGGWTTYDVVAEELTGEVINDAVYNRNSALEEAMNIDVTEQKFDVTADAMKQSVLAGTDDYDTVTEGIMFISPLVTQNMMLNFRSISTVKADAPYWDPQIYDDCAVMGKSFFMTGDISVMDNIATWCFLFNKDMIADHDLENPYELVDTGKWTLDKLDEMASVALNDTDGDGKWTNADDYGFITETYNSLALWACTGFKIMDNDADGKPYFSYRTENSIDSLTRCLGIQYADYSNLGSKSTVGVAADQSRESQFCDGKALFYYAGMTNITRLREYDTDFGVLPAPKLDEKQEQYWSHYSAWNFTVYVIPTTCSDPEMVGDILDAMAHLSLYTLTPAYYDQTLIGKSTRDEESEPMIELILNTRNFDLGVVFNTGSIRDTITGFSGPDKVASGLASKESAADTALETFITDISAIQ